MIRHHRAPLTACALLFAATAVTMSTQAKAHAADELPPRFPTCARTEVAPGVTRYWWKPGNLHVSPPAQVKVDGYDAVRRRDGVWVIQLGTPPRLERRWRYFTVRTEDGGEWGAWTRCERVRPR